MSSEQDRIAELERQLQRTIEQRDALKDAGDALIHHLSHPTRHGTPLMEAIVAYRRLSEAMDAAEDA